ncbi:class I SAM-dependent methyltransferase [Bacillus sp. TL12]|uniref:class I SAM-dependent methyltransferase n=1 Tax=Bacillus sp. TL12 TaxID=2894756 RepID=UPI001F52165C|nr:class I SAM-dependent methyltransferase [Bacillus sp. TL12]MCI0764732.1 class I SAM-dependent methyltransferase [Bacillus sp. TL12]
MSFIKRELFFQIFGEPIVPDNLLNSLLRNDFEPLLAFSQNFQPKTVIEIGIHKGFTAKCLLKNCTWIKKYIGIDVPPDFKTPLTIQQHEVPLIAGELVRNEPRVEIIIKPNGSRDIDPADLPTADLIFIDGDHSSKGVLYDTFLAREAIKKGGIICWHDYGNPLVPSVTHIIDYLNSTEGNHICQIEGSMLCFQFCRDGR